MKFPKDFLWGAGSASFQIEGAVREDGRGPSIWDEFSHQEGRIAGGFDADTASDAYHRWEEDLDLLKELGIPHYRFSISWSRVLPEGRGLVNEAGLAYYDKVISGCLQRNITPWITLYHWDLPLALEKEGGWRNRQTADAFAEYARLIAERFGDRVHTFITLNEPQCAIGMGYGTGVHAPGLKLSDHDQFVCWHHILLGHGLAAAEIRRICPAARVSVASTGDIYYLAERLPQIPEALIERQFHTPARKEDEPYFFNNHWFLDPVILGQYPDDPNCPWNAFKNDVPQEDLEIIHTRLDFLGLNLYNGREVREGKDGALEFVEPYVGAPRTAMRWFVSPMVLYWGPRLMFQRYGLPMIILENGQSCNDRVFLDGKVHDPDRIDYLTRYLTALGQSIEDGAPVQGYFHWSFTDNFEWHTGYDDRFGLIYVDFRDQTRIPKDSAYWYARVIAENSI